MILSFKKVFALTVIAVLLSAISVYGIHVITSTKVAVVPTSSTRSLTLELTLTLDKTEFELGEPVNITISLKNISNQTVTEKFPTHQVLGYIVEDENGTHVFSAYYDLGHLMVQTVITLNPGEEFSRTYVWTQVTYSEILRANVDVPRGTYKIYGATSECNPRLITPPIDIIIK